MQHGDLRQASLSEALFELAAESGVQLQTPLQIDSRGEYSIVAMAKDDPAPSKSQFFMLFLKDTYPFFDD